MMKRRLALSSAALLLALSSAAAQAPAPAAPRADASTRAIDALVQQAMKREQWPGVSVAVLRGGRMVLAKGYGFADLATEAPAAATTVYPIGAISQQFTAAGILFLAERERLQIGDPVGRYWPQFGARHPQITVEQLLRHTSGLREVRTLPDYDATAAAADGDRLLGLAAAAAPGFGPGARWSYSNTNYQVLARLIEAVDGEPYNHFLTEVLFKYAKLASVRACGNEAAAGEASGYLLRGRVLEAAPRENMLLARGDRGLCANAIDLVHWARALVRGDLLAPASLAALTGRSQLADGTEVAYGMGVALLPLEGRRRVAHDGAIGGYQSTLAYYPDNDLAIAVLTNRADAGTEALEKSIARRLLNLPAPRVLNLAAPAELTQRLIGAWDIGIAGIPLKIEARDNGELWLVAPAGDALPLQYQGSDRFISAPDAAELRLVRAADGTERLQATLGGLPWTGLRGGAAPEAVAAQPAPPTSPSPPAATAAAPQAPAAATAPAAAESAPPAPAPAEPTRPNWRGEDHTPAPRKPFQRP